MKEEERRLKALVCVNCTHTLYDHDPLGRCYRCKCGSVGGQVKGRLRRGFETGAAVILALICSGCIDIGDSTFTTLHHDVSGSPGPVYRMPVDEWVPTHPHPTEYPERGDNYGSPS